MSLAFLALEIFGSLVMYPVGLAAGFVVVGLVVVGFVDVVLGVGLLTVTVVLPVLLPLLTLTL